jgi:hypothetical protein
MLLLGFSHEGGFRVAAMNKVASTEHVADSGVVFVPWLLVATEGRSVIRVGAEAVAPAVGKCGETTSARGRRALGGSGSDGSGSDFGKSRSWGRASGGWVAAPANPAVRVVRLQRRSVSARLNSVLRRTMVRSASGIQRHSLRASMKTPVFSRFWMADRMAVASVMGSRLAAKSLQARSWSQRSTMGCSVNQTRSSALRLAVRSSAVMVP